MNKSDKDKKRRSAQAIAAWGRHAGAHNPGTKRPDVDDTEEQLDDFFDRVHVEVVGQIEIDGELLDIEWAPDDEGDDDE